MPIRILGISGSPVANSNTELLLKEALSSIEGPDVECEIFSLAGREFSDCIHCNWCMRKQTIDKACRLDDDLSELFPKVVEADGLMTASPVYLGRASGRLMSALDRIRSLHYGKVHLGGLKFKVAGGLAVGWYRHSGIETTLTSLHLFFLTYQMLSAVPGSVCTFGGGGVSSLGGTGRFDPKDKSQVLQDEFGLMTARETAKAMVELIRVVKKGLA